MITIVCSELPQRAALQALCTSRCWEVETCDGVRSFTRSLEHCRPKVIITRDKLIDGYSDDIIALALGRWESETKILVLLPASAGATDEARQIALGAEYVLRDPVRAEVLTEYLSRYYSRKPTRAPGDGLDREIPFAGAVLLVPERQLQKGARSVALTPRELALARCFATAPNLVLSYDQLFDQVLGRAFRGDTSNMRVLLGKLCTRANSIGVNLREQIEVLAKSGYRYSPPNSAS